MKLTAVLLFISFSILNTISAQNMMIPIGSKIKLNGNFYDFYESEELFKKVPIPYKMYQRALKAKKAGKGWGYTSLGSLGVGFLLIATTGSSDNCGSLCFTSGEVIGALSILIVFPVTGTIGIISSVNSKARLIKAADLYNSNRDLGYHKKEEVRLSLGLSQNGVELVLNF